MLWPKRRNGMSLAEKIEHLSIGEPNSGCWIWLRQLNKHGYGKINHNKKTLYSHRASWIAHIGSIPDELDVLHRCDNPACVNPDHLFMGTHSDNMRDMYKKKRRSQRGERNANAKFSDTDILYIRNSCEQKTELAEKYGVCIRTIEYIQSGYTWNHLLQETT